MRRSVLSAMVWLVGVLACAPAELPDCPDRLRLDVLFGEGTAFCLGGPFTPYNPHRRHSA